MAEAAKRPGGPSESAVKLKELRRYTRQLLKERNELQEKIEGSPGLGAASASEAEFDEALCEMV